MSSIDNNPNNLAGTREDLNKIPQPHTPGPWINDYQGRRQWAIVSRAPHTDSRRTDIVAEIKDPVGYMTHGENRANGNLIAAAPDMLSLLQSINEFFRHNNPVFPCTLFGEDGVTLKQAVCAVLAKATGGHRE